MAGTAGDTPCPPDAVQQALQRAPGDIKVVMEFAQGA
jgi:hypothetical protein